MARKVIKAKRVRPALKDPLVSLAIGAARVLEARWVPQAIKALRVSPVSEVLKASTDRPVRRDFRDPQDLLALKARRDLLVIKDLAVQKVAKARLALLGNPDLKVAMVSKVPRALKVRPVPKDQKASKVLKVRWAISAP